MRKKIYFLLLLSLQYFLITAQEKAITKEKLSYSFVSKEKIFLQFNSTLLLTGENLYYKVFCLSDRYKRLSNFSKVAYIELISPEKKRIFTHKIKLEKGVGDGSFFIPSSLKSGNYKVIAYTQAMRNEGKNYLFQADLGVVNPYTTLDSNLVEVIDNVPQKKSTSIKNSKNIEVLDLLNQYKQRDKVAMTIKGTGNTKRANVSISVRKIDSLIKPEQVASTNFDDIYPETTRRIIKSNELKFLPEIKGEILSGKVINNETNLPAPNVRVALSIPDEEFVLKFANTDKNGDFLFTLESKIGVSNALIQVIGQSRDTYALTIDKVDPFDYNVLSFEKLKISASEKNTLIDHSVYNQLENAYKSIKKDTLRNTETLYLETLKSNYTSEVYNLDDYNRFPTVKETIVEIVPTVWVSKKNKKKSFNVRKLNPYQEEKYKPIVLVDGMLVQDYEKLIDYNAYKIKSIIVIRNKFELDDSNFQGIINFITNDKDYHQDRKEEYVKFHTLINSLTERKYFKQEYNDGDKSNSRIPDYRTQLLWEPNINLKTQRRVEFYTSDVKGDFEVSIIGFFDDKTPISYKKIITIK